MKSQLKTLLTQPLKGIILGLLLAVGMSYAMAAWNGPTATPPNANTGAPIHVEAQGQSKSGNLIVGTGVTSGLGFGVTGGNVGIGTVNPEFKLDIIDDGTSGIQVNSSAVARLRLQAGSINGQSWDIDSDPDGSFRIWEEEGASWPTRFMIDSSGNVGIGTTNPTSLLDVYDGAVAPATISIGGGNTDNALVGELKFSTGPSSDRWASIQSGRGSDAAQIDLRFFTMDGDTSGIKERMRITDTGNVGIGTTNPTSLLHLFSNSAKISFNRADNGRTGYISINNPQGGLRYHGDVDGEGESPALAHQFTGDAPFGQNTAYMTIWGNGNVGIGTVSPAYRLHVIGTASADAHINNSDERLKKDIKKIENAVDKILNINGVSFAWKESGEKSIGLTAQNVEKVFPELVYDDENTGMKSVNYANLVAPLIEAVKEQQDQINQLEEELKEIKIQIGS